MKRVTTLMTTLVMAAGLVAMAGQAAQAPSGQAQAGQAGSGGRGRGAGAESQGSPVVLDATKPHDQYLTLDIVEVVGCLSDGPNNTFVLTDATDPVRSTQPSTTKAALDADKTKPLGTQRYVIIGATEWNPASHKGQKMAVKGLMIKDAKETRLNVTSFQMVDNTCTKTKR